MPVANPYDPAEQYLLAGLRLEVSLISDRGICRANSTIGERWLKSVDLTMTRAAYLGSRHQ